MDFETYSEAGFTWDASAGKWLKVGPKGGIADVGAWAYSRHPSTECLWLSYDMRDGKGVRDWMPWMPAPVELFDYVAQGGLIEAHNSFFEYCIWNNVFSRQMGAPPMPVDQLRDSAAACAAHGLPRSLEDAGRVMGCAQQKDTKAAAQVKKLWMPRKPTKADPSKRLTLEEQTELHLVNGAYCADDVRAEIALSDAVPHLSPYELEVWKLDQRINARGVGIDRARVTDAIEVIEQLKRKYVPMQKVLTDGQVKSPNSYAALRKWINSKGVDIPDTQADTITEYLEHEGLPQVVREVLEIQQLVGGAAIKKIYAMDRFVDETDCRVRGVFSYCGAASTGRWSSRGVQLHNAPNSGPDAWGCAGCGEHYGAHLAACPFCAQDVVKCIKCGSPVSRAGAGCCGVKPQVSEWGAEAAESSIRLISKRDSTLLEQVWGNALSAITACIRGFIVARDGHDLLCADYSAIEARVIAELAGEEWRLEVFRTHGKIYEMSAGKMLGLTLDDFKTYKDEHGSHHPARKKGKVAELACFAPDTLVLTAAGWKQIAHVLPGERVYDGEQFVPTAGVVSRGVRYVVRAHGVRVTRNHMVCRGNSWESFGEVSTALELPRDYPSALACWPAPRLRYPEGPAEIEVFDLLECGPNNRFVVLTDKGPLLAHNCGYQGGVGAMVKFGADKFMTRKEMKDTVTRWREASPNIVKLWYALEDATKNAVRNRGQEFTYRYITYQMRGNVLYCKLPSGRSLAYHCPRLTPVYVTWEESGRLDDDGMPERVRCEYPYPVDGGRLDYKLSYMADDKGQWRSCSLYGGLAVENATQAVARDLLADALLRLDQKGYPIIMHVHDEIIAEVPHGFGSIEEFEAIMEQTPHWAASWPIKADGGWRGLRYRK